MAPRHSQALAQRDVREGAQQATHLGAGRGVAIDAPIALLERHGGREGQGVGRAEEEAQQAAQNVKALRVDGAGEVGLAFDVDRAGCAWANRRRDAGWEPIRERPCVTDGQPIDLPHFRTSRLDTEGPLGHQRAEMAGGQVGAVRASLCRVLDVGLRHRSGAMPSRQERPLPGRCPPGGRTASSAGRAGPRCVPSAR